LANEKGTPWSGSPWTPDLNGEELPGISTFRQVDDEVFHTYSTFVHVGGPAMRVPDRYDYQ
jgi:hypothetical protein